MYSEEPEYSKRRPQQSRRCLPQTLRSRVFIIICSALFCLPVIFEKGHAAITDLETTEIPTARDGQERTVKLIKYLVEKSHYRKLPLDDRLSEKVLNAYIDQLDPGKSFFLQKDIDQFNVVRHDFDDFIARGVLDPAFSIFSVFRNRVDQRVDYALERLQQDFDFALDEDYLIDREAADWAADDKALDELWRKRIKNDILGLSIAGKENEEIMETLERRYTHLARRTRQFNSDDVFQTFVNAYVSSIEPHTSYFSPRASENFKIHMRLSLEGIGAVLQTDNEHTLVRRVIPGGPADMAGELKTDDRIVGVAQGEDEFVDVIGWRLDDVVELIRGPKESIVRLEILPGENGLNGETRIITIRRDKITLEEQAAKKRVLEVATAHGEATIGVIDLPSFYIDFDGMHKQLPDYRSTTRDVRKLLEEFQQENIDGLIIDLRGNGGGALTEAISLTGLFIKEGPVVQVKNSTGRVQVDRDPDPEIVYDGPLAVLVDRHSASASEIFAGAIQDYRRGLIIGEPTFGKGTVQNLINLNRFARNDTDLGQLKMTIAQFFRINGDSTQHRGIVPDVIWQTPENGEDTGERAFENAIPWMQINDAAFEYFQASQDPVLVDQLQAMHEQRVDDSAEFSYYMEVSEINRERRDTRFITLNEEKRLRERAQRDQVQLELENRRREALGEKTVATIEKLEEENDQRIKELENGEEETEPDFFLRESGSILGDYLHALASRETHGQTIVSQDSTDPGDALSN